MYLHRRHVVLGAAAALLPALTRAQAALPDVMKIIVPFPAGNAIDGTARWFGEAYRKVTGRTVVIDNKPGAATTIAASEVSRSRPDGSVVYWTTSSHITTAVLMKKVPYEPIAGFTPVTMGADGLGFMMVTRANAPFNNVQDVLEAARKKPGKITYASTGIGGPPHVLGAELAKSTGVDLLHIPYRGDFFTDLISGVTDVMFMGPSLAMQFIEAKKIKGLGMTGDRRFPLLPSVPTFAESGVKDVHLPSYIGIYAPPNMPAPVLAALYEGIAKTLKDPGLIAQNQTLGNEMRPLSPAEFRAYLQQELQTMKRTLPPLGIEMDV
ncbi:MAG: tripartite tricarboxylate transporter substrate binding protein [Comamonadaceae bacterium]|nr:MAG: tripartite tricarboxylate transporter substrate binding protein [Comamonadaceae bacterium]